MRQLGTLPDAGQATRLTDYLVAKGVHVQTEPAGDKFAIWVRNEDHLAEAKQEFETFLADPSNERYSGHSAAADEVRRLRQEKLDQAKDNVVDPRNLWTQPALNQLPVTMVLIGLCVAATIATGFGKSIEVVGEGMNRRVDVRPATEWLSFFRPSHVLKNGAKPDNPFIDVMNGEVWRLITPAFIHFSVMHLVFNAAMLYQLGGLIEQRHGSLFMGILSLAAAVLSNAGHEFIETAMIGGYSGVDYAYFGFVWIRSGLIPGVAYRMDGQTVVLMLAWLLFGFSGLSETMFDLRMANWAHLFGMVVGIAGAYAHASFKSKPGSADGR